MKKLLKNLQNLLSEIQFGFYHVEYCFNTWKMHHGYSKRPYKMDMYDNTHYDAMFWEELSDGWNDMNFEYRLKKYGNIWDATF